MCRDSCGGVGGGECDAVKAPAVMPGRDSFVRISVTDADDHTTQQITDSRRPKRLLATPCIHSRLDTENVRDDSKIVKKSCLSEFETKNVKNVRTVSFRGHLITPVFDAQLPKISTCTSATSNILLCNTVSDVTEQFIFNIRICAFKMFNNLCYDTIQDAIFGNIVTNADELR